MGENITNQDLCNLIQGLVKKSDDIHKQNESLKDELKQEIRSVKSDLTLELEKNNTENQSLKEENEKLKTTNFPIGTKQQKVQFDNLRP